MRRRHLLLTLVPLLVAVGCSDGGDDDAATSSSSATTAGEPSEADELCDILETAPYEDRKRALADAGPEGVADADCVELVEVLEAAMDIEARTAALSPEDVQVALDCDATTARLSITNGTAEANRLAGATSRYPPDLPEDPSRVGAAVVRWRIEPAEVVDEAVAIASIGPETCGVNADPFLAEDSDVDASVPGEAGEGGDDQADDDPDVWFPALLEAEREWKQAADPTGVARTEDLRSTAYATLVGEAGEPDPLADRTRADTICEVRPGPDERHVAIVYQSDFGAISYSDDDGAAVDLPEQTVTRLGVFRRGADDRWRWLNSAAFVQPGGCAAPR